MTAAEKRKTIAAIRKVARWMSDPRHRVKNWRHLYESARGEQKAYAKSACRTCILGGWLKVTGETIAPVALTTGIEIKGRNAFYEPWTTAELRKLFAESIKAVENA